MVNIMHILSQKTFENVKGNNKEGMLELESPYENQHSNNQF